MTNELFYFDDTSWFCWLFVKKSAIVARDTSNARVYDLFFVTPALLCSTVVMIGCPNILFILCSIERDGRS